MRLLLSLLLTFSFSVSTFAEASPTPPVLALYGGGDVSALLHELPPAFTTNGQAAHTPVGTPTDDVLGGAEAAPVTSDTTITPQARAAVIDSALSSLTEDYIFPEKAKEAAAVVRENAKNGVYEGITNGRAFGDTLTAHVKSVIDDVHFNVIFDQRNERNESENGEGSDVKIEEAILEEYRNNFGFNKVEHLEGNVGYIDINSFANFESARQTAAAAMAFVENTDALIIDVRRNGGGGRVVIDFLSSYFLGPNPVHLNSIYNGIQNYTEEFWTQAELPGERYGTDKPLYILTSKRTFSAAEEFSYNLKHLDRAVIVGEQTGGGAHPITIRRLTDEFVLRLPIARSINPVTGTNWEGTGVTPDNEVSAEEALKAAHLEALKSIARTSSEGKKEIKKLIEELEREMGAQKGGE